MCLTLSGESQALKPQGCDLHDSNMYAVDDIGERDTSVKLCAAPKMKIARRRRRCDTTAGGTAGCGGVIEERANNVAKLSKRLT